MKLVWIAQDLHIGGGQRVICELSGKMVERGHSVEILYPRGRGGFPVPSGVSARACGLEIPSPVGSLIVNLPAVIAAVPLCDWVLCSMPVSAFTGFAAAKLRRTGMLYYIMNDERALFDDRSLISSGFLLDLYHGLTDLAHRLPVEIAVNSRWTGTRVGRNQASDYPLIHHGIDPGIFKPEGETLPRSDKFVILTVGRRHRWKGLEDLFQALNIIREDAGDAFELWIITQDELDCSAAKFSHKTIKPSSDQEIAAALRSADLMVHPSWFEGFGLPPLEAMACGTPAVVTDSGGVSEYARDRENCLLVPARNPRELAAAVRILMKDESKRRRMAKSGLKTAAQFTWDHAADQLETILQSAS